MTFPVGGWLVLDSHAVLALVREESSADEVRELLGTAPPEPPGLAMSVINLGEVYYQLIRERGLEEANSFVEAFEAARVTLFDVDWGLTKRATQLKANHPIAYADCVAAALAMQLEAAVVTGDPEFRRIEHLVPVHWLAPAAGSP